MIYNVLCNGANNGKICIDNLSVPTTPTIIDIYSETTGVRITNLATPSTSPTGVVINVVSEGISVNLNGKYCWDNLPAGKYIIEITDSSRTTCYVKSTVEITEPESLNYTYTIDKINCGLNSNLQITPIGGVGPYKITLSKAAAPIYPPKTNYTGYFPNIPGDSLNDYVLTIFDYNGCSLASTINVDDLPSINLTVGYSNVTCNGACNGTIDVLATGGLPPYVFTISSNPAGTFVKTSICDISECTSYTKFTDICAGSYIVKVTDSLGCTRTQNLTITQPSKITLTDVLLTQITCLECCDGSISIDSITGGVGPYSVYLTKTDEFLPDYKYTDGVGPLAVVYDDLKAGDYDLVVTDSNNCSITYKFKIYPPVIIDIS